MFLLHFPYFSTRIRYPSVNKVSCVGVVESSTTHQDTWKESCLLVNLVIGRRCQYRLSNKQSNKCAPTFLTRVKKKMWKVLNRTGNHRQERNRSPAFTTFLKGYQIKKKMHKFGHCRDGKGNLQYHPHPLRQYYTELYNIIHSIYSAIKQKI